MTASALDQSTIWYSASNEDAQSEIGALKPEGKKILTLTASGSRAFELLLADPSEVISIDQNPAQTALAEIYAVAYKHFDYDAFCRLTGLRQDEHRSALLDEALRHVSSDTERFWRANRNQAAGGLLYCGRWESFLRRFRQWAGSRRRALADELLHTHDLTTQALLWETRWDNWQWRLLLRVIALRGLWRHILREPGISYVPDDFDMTGYARARFEHLAKNLHIPELPFAWLVFNGAYHPDILPPYLTQKGHALIAQRIERLTLQTTDLRSFLTSAPTASLDGASLSDYASYCDENEQRAVWRELARTLRCGAVVCERKFFNKTGAGLPGEFGFTRDEALEDVLFRQDGAWFYSFVVARQVQK